MATEERKDVGGRHHLGERLLHGAKAHVGAVDGVGYRIIDVRGGRGFSYNEYAMKELPNGRMVWRRTYFPGPFDGLAGLTTDIEETFDVWVGWEPYDEALQDVPPIPVPQGAKRLTNPDISDDSQWFATFDDQAAAEAFALSQDEIPEGVRAPALVRNL